MTSTDARVATASRRRNEASTRRRRLGGGSRRSQARSRPRAGPAGSPEGSSVVAVVVVVPIVAVVVATTTPAGAGGGGGAGLAPPPPGSPGDLADPSSFRAWPARPVPGAVGGGRRGAVLDVVTSSMAGTDLAGEGPTTSAASTRGSRPRRPQ